MSQIGFEMLPDTDAASRRGGVRPSVIVFLVIISGLVGLSFAAVSVFNKPVEAWSGPGTTTVRVVIPPGASGASIGRILAQAGVVSSADDFVAALEDNPRATLITPGTYDLRAKMGPVEAVTLLVDPASRKINKLVLPEGLRATAATAAIVKATGLSTTDVEASLGRASELGLPDWADGNAEGFLFPATYQLAPGASADTVVSTLIKRFGQSASRIELETRAEDRKMTAYDALIVASLVQGEGDVEDYPKVARVIYNRLAKNMPLQLDSTINYAQGSSEISLSQEALDTPGPYNTYLNKGLPPTPINSPGDKAMEAALAPAKGDWLYFVTVDPSIGTTKFTSSYQEFLRFKREFQSSVQ